jgi:hypothetical protein
MTSPTGTVRRREIAALPSTLSGTIRAKGEPFCQSFCPSDTVEFRGHQAEQQKEQQIQKRDEEQQDQLGWQVCASKALQGERHADPDERKGKHYHGFEEYGVATAQGGNPRHVPQWHPIVEQSPGTMKNGSGDETIEVVLQSKPDQPYQSVGSAVHGSTRTPQVSEFDFHKKSMGSSISVRAGNSVHYAALSWAAPALRYPLVPRPHQRDDSGKFRRPYQRPRPPQLARDGEHRVGPKVVAPVREDKANRMQQLLLRKAEQYPHSRILQRGHGQAASLQWTYQPHCNRGAELALCVKEKPSSSVLTLSVRHFRRERDHGCLIGLPFFFPPPKAT